MISLRAATPRCARACIALVLGGALTVTVAVTSLTSGAATPSATALVAAALANAKASHWVHETVDIYEEGVVVESSHDVIGATGGEQSEIIANGGTSELLALDASKTLYVRADAAALTTTYSMTSTDAATFSNEWLELTPSNSIYDSVAFATTLASDFSQVRFTGPVREGGVGVLEGKKVRAIAGTVPPINGAPRFKGTLDVTATGRLLPLRFRESRGSTVIVVTWSKWGQGTTLSAPSGAVAYPTS
jgi:hypothetical protein